jgi:outer membrane scaffolding protein for murein synthesis (MipA/OmpV family)
MPDLGTLLEFGPRLKVKLGSPSPASRVRLEVPLRSVIEVRSGVRRQGWTFEPKLVYEWRDAQNRWTFDANLALVAGDAGINRYFYEVAPRYAALGRPAYKAEAGLILVRAGVSASRRIGPDLRVFGFVRQESYAGAANRDSPLFQKNTGASAGVGFSWTLMRSTARAKARE